MGKKLKGGQNQTPDHISVVTSPLASRLPATIGNLFLGACVFFLMMVGATPGVGGAEPDRQTIFTMEVEPMAGPGMPAAQLLRDEGEKLIKQLFPEEVSKSQKVFGKIKQLEQPGKAQVFELQATFLYQKTYTAVNKRVTFTLLNNQAKVLSHE